MLKYLESWPDCALIKIYDAIPISKNPSTFQRIFLRVSKKNQSGIENICNSLWLNVKIFVNREICTNFSVQDFENIYSMLDTLKNSQVFMRIYENLWDFMYI